MSVSFASELVHCQVDRSEHSPCQHNGPKPNGLFMIGQEEPIGPMLTRKTRTNRDKAEHGAHA